MRLVQGLALAGAVGAWVVILIGGYVSHTGSGLACPGLIDCGTPRDPQAAAIELTHRVAAWVEGLIVLALFLLSWLRFRAWVPFRNLVTLGLLLIILQAALGILTVATGEDVLASTAHTGVAAAFLAVMVLCVATAWRGPPTSVESSATPRHSARRRTSEQKET